MDVNPAAILALLLLAGCTGSGGEGGQTSNPTHPATTALKDALLLAAVKATLVADDPDSTTTVGVAVNDGVVTLRGSVKDAETRRRIVADARKTGEVKRVVDELRVDPNGPRLKERVGDVALAARIETAITAQVGVQPVAVRVDRGIASLEGTVGDAKTKATIVATAHGTTGVRNVVDRIRVAGP